MAQLDPVPHHEIEAWREGHIDDRSSTRCAACGEVDEVKPDPRCGDVPFCGSCRERSRGLTEWDDLGVGD